MKKILMGDDSLPPWMTHGHTVLCQKDPRKGSDKENLPIKNLPMAWIDYEKVFHIAGSMSVWSYLELQKT